MLPRVHAKASPRLYGIDGCLKLVGAFVGLSYATGFVVVFSYLGSFGITDFGGELLRLKYVYIGVLCVAFPLFICLPLVLMARDLWPRGFFDDVDKSAFARELERNKRDALNSLPAVLVVINLISVAYTVIGLSEPDQFRSRDVRIMVLASASMLSLLFVKKLAHRYPKWKYVGRAAVFCIAACFDFYALRGIQALSIFTTGAYVYVILMAIAVWRAVRTDSKYRYEMHLRSPTIFCVQVAIALTLYIAGCLSYAFSVYPHISADWGGGDYMLESPSVFCLTGVVVPAELMQPKLDPAQPNKSCTVPVKIVHETDKLIYVLLSSELDSKVKQSKSRPPFWLDWDSLPTTYGIESRSIASISGRSEVNERSVDVLPIPIHTAPERTEPSPAVTAHGKSDQSKGGHLK
jgi:hypothetical protein